MRETKASAILPGNRAESPLGAYVGSEQSGDGRPRRMKNPICCWTAMVLRHPNAGNWGRRRQFVPFSLTSSTFPRRVLSGDGLYGVLRVWRRWTCWGPGQRIFSPRQLWSNYGERLHRISRNSSCRDSGRKSKRKLFWKIRIIPDWCIQQTKLASGPGSSEVARIFIG